MPDPIPAIEIQVEDPTIAVTRGVILATVSQQRAEQRELKDLRKKLKEEFENDSEFAVLGEQIKDLNLKKKQVKDRILARREILQMEEQIKDISRDIKERQLTINDLLSQYIDLSGQMSLFDNDRNLEYEVTATYNVFPVLKKSA